MGWLNSVVALPGFAVTAETGTGYPAWLIDTLPKLGDAWRKAEVVHQFKFTSPVDVHVQIGDGALIVISPGNITFVFQYTASVVQRFGGRPEVKITPGARPYSEILGELRDLAKPVLAHLHDTLPFGIDRIGVIAESSLPEGSAPPGAASFLERLEAPVGHARFIDSTLLKVLSDGKESRDRCHYVVKMNRDDDPGGFHLRLDFQRLWKRGVMMRRDVDKVVGEVIESAEAHFEAFGSDSEDAS